MRKASGALHILHGIPLHLLILGLLLQNTQQLVITRVGANTVNNRERELALGQVLAQPLIARVRRIRQIQVVVADLENQAHDVHQGDAVLTRRALSLHQFHRESEETACLVADHLEVFVLGWAGEGVAPEEIHALAAVEVEQFFDVDVDCDGVVELLDFLQGEEVDVVGRVDRLGGAEDIVGDGDAATEDGGVFDVVDSENGLSAENSG